MKTTYLILFICFLFNSHMYSQKGKHSVSLSVGYGIPIDNTIYMNSENPDIDIWMDPKTNIPISLSYEYGISDFLKAGAGIEYEKMNFDSYYTGKSYANRLAFGIHSIALYPATSFHAEFGAFLNFGILNSPDFNNSVSGIEYGVLIGPGYSMENINIAIHFKPQFSYYPISKSDAPESVLVMYPRILAKISYAF